MERASFARRLCPRLTRSSASRVSWHNWPAGPQTWMTLTSLWPKESNGGTTESKWNLMTTSWTQNTFYPTTSNQVWVFIRGFPKNKCAPLLFRRKRHYKDGGTYIFINKPVNQGSIVHFVMYRFRDAGKSLGFSCGPAQLTIADFLKTVWSRASNSNMR